MSGFFEGFLIIFTLKVWEILNFELLLSIYIDTCVYSSFSFSFSHFKAITWGTLLSILLYTVVPLLFWHLLDCYLSFFHLDNINLKTLKFLQLRWEIKCQTNFKNFQTLQPVDFEKTDIYWKNFNYSQKYYSVMETFNLCLPTVTPTTCMHEEGEQQPPPPPPPLSMANKNMIFIGLDFYFFCFFGK